jgi:hypothetical protein
MGDQGEVKREENFADNDCALLASTHQRRSIMSAWRKYSLAVVALGGLLLTACGGSMFRSAKTIADPLALNGRLAPADTNIGGDALTASLSASGSAEYAFGNTIASVAPYAGLERMTLSQRIRVRLQCEPNAGMPGSISLRNVSLSAHLRVSDTDDAGTPRQSPTIPLNYRDTLTLARQADGSYLTNATIPFSVKLSKSEGEGLLAILASGKENTMRIQMELRAETLRANIPNGATVTLTVEFDDSSAYLEW